MPDAQAKRQQSCHSRLLSSIRRSNQPLAAVGFAAAQTLRGRRMEPAAGAHGPFTQAFERHNGAFVRVKTSVGEPVQAGLSRRVHQYASCEQSAACLGEGNPGSSGRMARDHQQNYAFLMPRRLERRASKVTKPRSFGCGGLDVRSPSRRCQPVNMLHCPVHWVGAPRESPARCCQAFIGRSRPACRQLLARLPWRHPPLHP